MEVDDMIIETKRLLIRPFKTEDYAEWDKGYKNRHASTYKHDEGYDDSSAYDQEWFEDWIQGFHKTAKKDVSYVFGIFRKEDGLVLGELELFTILRMDYNWGMMGYSIHNQFYRQGYGKESVQAAAEFFFYSLQFHRIELQINIDNEPSKRLAESVGFIYECTREAFFYENGKWIDNLIYYKNRIH